MSSRAETPSEAARKKALSTFDKLLRDFDRGLVNQIQALQGSMNAALDRLEKRIKRTERHLHRMYKKVINNCEQEMKFADGLVAKELKSKILTSQWTNKFLSEGTLVSLNPITFAFAR